VGIAKDKPNDAFSNAESKVDKGQFTQDLKNQN
jgi:hypothetical protein